MCVIFSGAALSVAVHRSYLSFHIGAFKVSASHENIAHNIVTHSKFRVFLMTEMLKGFNLLRSFACLI